MVITRSIFSFKDLTTKVFPGVRYSGKLSTNQYSSLPASLTASFPLILLLHCPGAPSVVSHTSLSQGIILSLYTLIHFQRFFSPMVVLCISLMSKFSLVMHKPESTPQIKMVSCAVLVMSVHSTTASEYEKKCFLFQSTVLSNQWPSHKLFLLRLTFANACFVLDTRHRTFLIIQLFGNSVKGRAGFGISSTIIRIIFTVAPLCDFALVKKSSVLSYSSSSNF